MKRPYREHLKSSRDLETTYPAIRAGFVALALERNRQATPFVEEARALQLAASAAKTPLDLLKISDIQAGLLTAAGVSDKAGNYLQPDDKIEAIGGLIREYLEPAGDRFVEELVFRFLLTRGDALGGSMRNIGGALAQRKLTRAILSTLRIAGIAYEWLHSETGAWTPMPQTDADIEIFCRGIRWQKDGHHRTMLYNLTVPLVGNNVDLCLLACASGDLAGKKRAKETLASPGLYLALGELKGGIDPAGADEHWKTARTALSRIRETFQDAGYRPSIFFVGAAVERRMAAEIWEQLKSGLLANAANLTSDTQVASLSRWLCNL